ncbi:MAG: Jag N-terminal domain-containing protein [Proteobacteria bacterium]|nr:Jag N-terminal domain-containing protein [Pseudomonadota bacterium]MBU4295454.1 Jag N-terminal domain-containing protein [Pseudomonadota bacterium]MCG2747641.1 Jag N-terminal domain-containing protein [Desulfobulbaceae bacterium]
MGSKQQFKGKDVDEAITMACDKLGVPREELSIEILSTGSSGIFGLCRKQAIIRATKKKPDTKSAPEGRSAPMPSPVVQEKPSPAAPPAAAPPAIEHPADEQIPPTAESQPAEQPSQPVEEQTRRKRQPVEERPQEPTVPLTPEVLAQIKGDLEQMLTLMDFPSEIVVEEKNNKAQVKISGEHIEELITKDGQALDSIQYLMRKIISKKFPQKIMFSIDAGEFREKRKVELQELALKLAQEVKETEKTKTIPPLNPAERRVVHLVLQDDSTIRSRSVGDGLFKKILIYLPGKGRIRKKPQRRKPKKEKLTITE